VAARTNREGERVDSPEESRPMGLTVNENLRANWILEPVSLSFLCSKKSKAFLQELRIMPQKYLVLALRGNKRLFGNA
jgi:hypothetical protein